MAEVSYADRRLTGSVTERLSARLDEVEAVQARMLKNEAKLIADSVTMDARLENGAEACQERWDAQSETNMRLIHRHADLAYRTLWGRLRWLVTGR